DVEAAAIVEIELRRLIDHRLRVVAAAEVEARGRHAADGTAFHREGELAEPAGFGGDCGDRFRQADAEVDDVAGANLAQGARADALAVRLRQGWQIELGTGRDIGGVEGAAKGLVMAVAAGDNDAIDED